MIDAVVYQEAPFQWGPIIVVMLTASIAAIGWLTRYVFKALTEHTTALAVLISETRPAIKVVNEVIDLKLSSAEMNEKLIGHDTQFVQLWAAVDRTGNNDNRNGNK